MSHILDSPFHAAIGSSIRDLWYIKTYTKDEIVKIKCQEMMNFFYDKFPDSAPKPETISDIPHKKMADIISDRKKYFRETLPQLLSSQKPFLCRVCDFLSRKYHFYAVPYRR